MQSIFTKIARDSLFTLITLGLGAASGLVFFSGKLAFFVRFQ